MGFQNECYNDYRVHACHVVLLYDILFHIYEYMYLYLFAVLY